MLDFGSGPIRDNADTYVRVYGSVVTLLHRFDDGTEVEVRLAEPDLFLEAVRHAVADMHLRRGDRG